MKKRLLAALVCIMLVTTLLPTAALAADDRAIQLGTGDVGDYDRLYFGKYSSGATDYDVPWFVLPKQGVLTQTSVAQGANVIPLLSQYLLGAEKFSTTGTGYYPNSPLRGAMFNIYASFSSGEQEAVASSTLSGESIGPGQSEMSGQRLFSLSYSEGKLSSIDSSVLPARSITNPAGSVGYWWTRTSGDEDSVYAYDTDPLYAGYVFTYKHVVNECGVRPAFNLITTNILFSSAATGGKSAAGMNYSLAAVPATAPTEWKLTLQDQAHKPFSVTSLSTQVTREDGGNAVVDFQYAITGTNEYLSAVILDSSDNVLYYGRLSPLTVNSYGSVTFHIPDGLTGDSYTLGIFNEQYNGDRKTDYASSLRRYPLPVMSASIGDVTFSGTQSRLLSDTDLTITLKNLAFSSLSADDDVSSWFGNLPDGLSARVRSAGTTSATITISGTPTVASAAPIELAIPGDRLNKISATSNLKVTDNPNAAWAINSPGPSVIVTEPDADRTIAASIGSSVKLTVTATNANMYQWQHFNGTDFVPIPGATSASLYLRSVTPAEIGNRYRCHVSNTGGSETISPVFTLLEAKPADVPETGDSATPMLWLGLALMACAGLAVSLVLRRKRQNG